MEMISILDCTLRDGGWANDFLFGRERMRALFAALRDSKIEYMELGYLDAARADRKGQSMYSSAEALQRELPECRTAAGNMCGRLKKRLPKTGMSCFVMIDYGKYPLQKLPACHDSGIDGIRLCFHKKDAMSAIEDARMILEKDYFLMLQPMVCTRYTDQEFAELLLTAQRELHEITAVYIVDSFGSMRQKDVLARLHLADQVLPGEISLGLHAHDNLHLAFANAISVAASGIQRNVIIDGTLAGMGKGAGNLRTEIFAGYLNQNAGKQYNCDRLENAAETLIQPLRAVHPWGCCTEYELSALYRLTPSYAKFFRAKCNLSIEEMRRLLLLIPEEKKDSFDRRTAEELFSRFSENKGGTQKDDRSA